MEREVPARPGGRWPERTTTVVAGLFGLATIVAGGRVLAGTDPGYEVFLPLLVFNTAMGAVYIVAAVIMARSANRGHRWAVAIFVLNLIVLATVVVLFLRDWGIATASLAAMTFRTAVWAVVAAVLVRREHPRRHLRGRL